MGADAAWRVTGFVLRVRFCFYLACFRERLENRVLETAVVSTLIVSGCWISFLMGIVAFKSAKIEVWLQLECAPK